MTKEAVAGANVTVKDTSVSATTDAQGAARLSNIPDGAQTIVIFSPGYETKELKLTFPTIETVVFIRVTNEVGEITVTSTRTGREIDDVPTRVEAIDEEEVDEKTNMRPANVSMVLNESTGIKVQQTSATSNTQSVRIQHQLFFYTEIQDPLVLLETLRFVNAAQPVRSRGFETNARLSYDIVKLFAGYTFTNADAAYLVGNQTLPLTPKSRINSALLFEREADFKTGIEAYYTSSQFLTNGFRTRPFWVLGIFGEKTFGKYSLFINFENITDTRQGRFTQVVFPPHQTPSFSEIYTHTEGRVINGGIKIRL